VPQGHRGHLEAAAVVEHRLIREVENQLRLQVDDGLSEGRPRVGGGTHLGVPDRGEPLRADLFGSAGHDGTQNLVAGRPIGLQGPFHHGWVVLSVDYDNAANWDFLPIEKS
jgi:hypothetical protein